MRAAWVLRRFRTQSGSSGAPPFEPTTKVLPSKLKYGSTTERRRPLLRPLVINTSALAFLLLNCGSRAKPERCAKSHIKNEPPVHRTDQTSSFITIRVAKGSLAMYVLPEIARQ